jgi:hypothetical protein
MRPTAIEAWAHQVMDRVLAGQPNEDARVELKATWIADGAMARRLAAHANAARMDHILWIVGVDEKARSIPGVEARDAAEWFPRVQACFEGGVVPKITDVVVQRGAVSVVALFFETERPPYVVRNEKHGTSGHAIQYEVPWREGTITRSARRDELLRILTPSARLPQVELRAVFLQTTTDANRMLCRFLLYVVPPETGTLYLPLHHCRVRARQVGREWIDLDNLRFVPDDGPPSGDRSHRPSQSIAATETELVVHGAGGAILSGNTPLAVRDQDKENRLGIRVALDGDAPIEVDLTLGVARATSPVHLTMKLDPVPKAKYDAARWEPNADDSTTIA